MTKTPIPSFVIFGNTGSGKSTLANTLTETNSFKESNDVNSETDETIGIKGTFDHQETFAIDTPGLHDTRGNDTQHLCEMTNYIKKHKEVQAFIIVVNFMQMRLDDSVKRLFQLVADMYPEKKWYHNLAVLWSNYYKFLPPNLKDTEIKRNGFKNFFKEIEKNISDIELNNIPQYFVDSIDARDENMTDNNSREDLKHLVAWISQLPTLESNFGEIKKVDKEIKKETEEKETKVISDTTKLNIRTIVKADFKRLKRELYNGQTTYTDWTEIENSRVTTEEVLPLAPVGEPTTEKRNRSEAGGSWKQHTWTESSGRRYLIMGPREYTEHGEIYQTYTDYVEERSCQPMNDGSIKYSEWKIISQNNRNVCIGSY